MEDQKTDKPIIQDDEIDLVVVAKNIWEGRKFILKVTAIFIVIGLIVAFGSKVEYKASCKLLPESDEGIQMNLGGLGGLASLAGMDLGSMAGGSGAITPDLYPEVAKSMPFQLRLLNTPIRFDDIDTTYTSFYYFKEVDKPSLIGGIVKYTIGLPFQIKKWLSSSDDEVVVQDESAGEIIKITKEDSKIVEKFQDRISVEVDSKTGVISISAEMPDARAAAEVTNSAYKLLTEYLIDYKISKAQQNLDFVQERYEESKLEFVNAQKRLAAFNDRNRNVVTAMAQTELERLQNEYNIAFEVYKGLATQLEQSKIAVKEETPVFKVLEPVKVPVDKKRPKRTIILSVFIITGISVSLVIMYFKNKF
jgi:uncharacterized protein involved in exopolysaccharide biosynthesis